VPRLSNAAYLRRHYLLHKAWFDLQGKPFSYLSPREQWDLHAYYQPYKHLSEEELLAHRVKISKDRPSLPAKAGKAYANLAAGRVTGVTSSSNGKRQFSVRGIMNPEIDLKQLSRALIAMAEEQTRQQQATNSKDRLLPKQQ